MHREIGALVIAKRQEELDQLRDKMDALGFTPDDLTSRKPNGKSQASPKYRDPESGGKWSGKGHRPQWLRDALDGGRTLEEFLIS